MIVTNSLTGGGAERSMNLVANELSKRGFTVSLVPINSGPPDRVAPSCEVLELHRQWKGGLLNTLEAILRFNRIVKSWKPDVMILNCDLPELFGAVLFGKHKLVVLEHASNPWASRVLIGRLVRKILGLRNTVWVAVSSHLTIWPHKSKPAAILQNPIILSDTFQSYMPGDRIKRLVFIGRLSPEKRPELALEISQRANVELLIIGDGLLKNDLERKVLRESIKVTFLGRVDDPWLKVQSGDLLIVPSLSEGDGLVVIEGLQKGVPMLLANIPDLRRFSLPDSNYCQTVDDFVNRLANFENRLENLIIDAEVSADILKPRLIGNVGNAWVEFLELSR